MTSPEAPIEDLITIIITTSPVQSNPSTFLTNTVVNSLSLVPALHRCRKIIICDGVKISEGNCNWKAGKASPEAIERYQQYIAKLEALSAQGEDEWYNSVILPLPYRHGFSYGALEGIKLVTTPYTMVIQHDRAFNQPIRLETLMKDVDFHHRIWVDYVADLLSSCNIAHLAWDPRYPPYTFIPTMAGMPEIPAARRQYFGSLSSQEQSELALSVTPQWSVKAQDYTLNHLLSGYPVPYPVPYPQPSTGLPIDPRYNDAVLKVTEKYNEIISPFDPSLKKGQSSFDFSLDSDNNNNNNNQNQTDILNSKNESHISSTHTPHPQLPTVPKPPSSATICTHFISRTISTSTDQKQQTSQRQILDYNNAKFPGQLHFRKKQYPHPLPIHYINFPTAQTQRYLTHCRYPEHSTFGSIPAYHTSANIKQWIQDPDFLQKTNELRYYSLYQDGDDSGNDSGDEDENKKGKKRRPIMASGKKIPRNVQLQLNGSNNNISKNNNNNNSINSNNNNNSMNSNNNNNNKQLKSPTTSSSSSSNSSSSSDSSSSSSSSDDGSDDSDGEDDNNDSTSIRDITPSHLRFKSLNDLISFSQDHLAKSILAMQGPNQAEKNNDITTTSSPSVSEQHNNNNTITNTPSVELNHNNTTINTSSHTDDNINTISLSHPDHNHNAIINSLSQYQFAPRLVPMMYWYDSTHIALTQWYKELYLTEQRGGYPFLRPGDFAEDRYIQFQNALTGIGAYIESQNAKGNGDTPENWDVKRIRAEMGLSESTGNNTQDTQDEALCNLESTTQYQSSSTSSPPSSKGARPNTQLMQIANLHYITFPIDPLDSFSFTPQESCMPFIYGSPPQFRVRDLQQVAYRIARCGKVKSFADAHNTSLREMGLWLYEHSPISYDNLGSDIQDPITHQYTCLGTQWYAKMELKKELMRIKKGLCGDENDDGTADSSQKINNNLSDDAIDFNHGIDDIELSFPELQTTSITKMVCGHDLTRVNTQCLSSIAAASANYAVTTHLGTAFKQKSLATLIEGGNKQGDITEGVNQEGDITSSTLPSTEGEEASPISHHLNPEEDEESLTSGPRQRLQLSCNDVVEVWAVRGHDFTPNISVKHLDGKAYLRYGQKMSKMEELKAASLLQKKLKK